LPGMASGMRMARAGTRICTACDRHPGCVPGCAGCGAGRSSGVEVRVCIAGSRVCAQGLGFRWAAGDQVSGVRGWWRVSRLVLRGAAWRVCGVVFLVGVPVVVRA
jgi:hypothetical protein